MVSGDQDRCVGARQVVATSEESDKWGGQGRKAVGAGPCVTAVTRPGGVVVGPSRWGDPAFMLAQDVAIEDLHQQSPFVTDGHHRTDAHAGRVGDCPHTRGRIAPLLEEATGDVDDPRLCSLLCLGTSGLHESTLALNSFSEQVQAKLEQGTDKVTSKKCSANPGFLALDWRLELNFDLC